MTPLTGGQEADNSTPYARRFVFTGRLLSMSKRDACRHIAKRGGKTIGAVSRRTYMLVVGMGGWPLLPSGKTSVALRRAETLNHDGAAIRIASELEFLEWLGIRKPASASPKSYDADEICRLAGVDDSMLRRWEQLSLVRSCDGKYDFQDLVSLRRIATLVAAGARPDVIHKSLRGMARVIPDVERPLSQLQIVMGDSGSLLAELGDHLVSADGQLVWNFDEQAHEFHAEAIATVPVGEPGGPSDAFERARQLEEDERFEEALEAYRLAIGEKPEDADTYFNLGNVLRALERNDAAVELYRIAASIDPGFAEAWYNLADLYEESGRFEFAVTCLERALEIASDFADAHFNLALLYEQLDDRSAAAECWRHYLRLAPDGPWSETARINLEQGRLDPV